ncbi:uncharacterized protein [Rutidosis leptorrhynchoides]|uniref:uncharacterized protein isoform X2 n=1 Tax=Rutidosis leptorrhynchoides TaxID=125765 RepID=UPI003A99213F
MYPISTMHIFSLLTMLVFILSKSGANHFNKSLEGEALVATHWWEDKLVGTDHCTWYGITCNKAGSVKEIYVDYMGSNKGVRDLGSLHFASLPNLQVLEIVDIGFEGSIPDQIGLLSKLVELSLRGNWLTGKIPAGLLANLTQLTHLDLSLNNFMGSIPPSLTNLTQLRYLYLSRNNFTGPIPPSLTNLTQLTVIDLSQNKFTGPIPTSLTNLTQLTDLDLSQNKFTGPIPSSITNLTQLTFLHLSQNKFTGPIPSSLTNLTQLTHLLLSQNKFTGPIPSSLTDLTQLTYLDLSRNKFTGPIPPSLTDLTQLTDLDLSRNKFTGPIPPSLTNLTQLTYLDLSKNNLTGPIPPSLTNLTQLQYLNLSRNNFTGPIPPSFGSMTNLTSLDLSTNQLSASIPKELSHLQHLYLLDLSDYNLDGPIPSSFGNLTQLKFLNLSINHISDSIPLELANLKMLENFDLHRNSLVGPVPPAFRELLSLGYLDFSSNKLSENVLTFQYPCYLSHLDLSMNRITGTLTRQLDECFSIEFLDISSNGVSGDIPLLHIEHLTHINLSHNHLTGVVPSYLTSPWIGQNIEVDLSFNDLSGLSYNNFSRQFTRNESHNIHLVIILPITIIIGFCFLVACYACYRHQSKAKTNTVHPEIEKHGNMCSILNYDGTIAYEDFITATQDFDLKYCIGTGGYGSVYEAKLPSGKTFALKKLHRFEAKQPALDQSFKNEIELLTNLRHKNIVRLYGFCLHNKCNFLVYEYMEKGSLFYALNCSELAIELDWMKRVNIIKDVAHALAYMHHDCNPPIVHRDISSNNVLLNSKMEGFVADFGEARLLDPDSSNQTVIAGTLGYIAPDVTCIVLEW